VLEEWNRLNDTLQAITGYYAEDVSELSGELPEKLQRVFVAPRFLQVMGVAPSQGRDFSPQEDWRTELLESTLSRCPTIKSGR